MKAEIDTLHVECPLCWDDIEVPVMVDQGTEPKRVTLTLVPDLTKIRQHAQGHLAAPEKAQRESTDGPSCAHGISLWQVCYVCEPPK